MMKYPELSKKYRGNCDEDCLREKTRFATDISRIERKTESAMDEAIQQVEEKSSKLRELNDKLMEVGEIWSRFVNQEMEREKADSERDAKISELTQSIEASQYLSDDDGKSLIDLVGKAMAEFTYSQSEEECSEGEGNWNGKFCTQSAPFDDIVKERETDINGLEGKAADLDKRRLALHSNFEDTKTYMWSQADTELINKVGNAVGSISSAIDKFKESSDVKMVLSGVLDVATAISEFLPEPANAIMGPLAAVFNGLFGIGGSGPTPEEVIREEMSKMKRYLEKEFAKLHEAIEKTEKVARDNAITELVGDLSNSLQFLTSVQAYLRPLENRGAIQKSKHF